MTDEPARLRRDPPRTPRWVIILGALAALIAIAFVVLHFTGGAPVDHGM
jgi:hypothetical protein